MRIGSLVLLVLLLWAGPLMAADTPHFELAGSYAFMRDTTRGENYPAGWTAAATGNVTSWIGVVVEAGGSYFTCDTCARGPFASQRFEGTKRRIAIHTYLAGPRVASHASALFTPYAQLLVGGSHISGGVEWDGALNTGLTYQPGAGVDVAIAPNAAIRVQGDYRVIRTSGRHNNEPRFLVGVVVRRGTL